MFLDRKQELSIYYWIKDLFETYPNVNVVDEYPDLVLDLPTVAIESSYIDVRPFELGERQGKEVRLWFINIFASNKAQRGEFASLIKEQLKEGIAVFDYDEGFPPAVTPTRIGTLITSSIIAEPVRIFPELVEKLYWRMSIRFITEYGSIS